MCSFFNSNFSSSSGFDDLFEQFYIMSEILEKCQEQRQVRGDLTEPETKLIIQLIYISWVVLFEGIHCIKCLKRFLSFSVLHTHTHVLQIESVQFNFFGIFTGMCVQCHCPF